MVYAGIESSFTPVESGQAYCKKCGAQTEHILLVADKKAKLELFITVAKWQACYLVCVPCSQAPKPWWRNKRAQAQTLRKHISKDEARAFVERARAEQRAELSDERFASNKEVS